MVPEPAVGEGETRRDHQADEYRDQRAHQRAQWYLASSMSARPNQGVSSHSANMYSPSGMVRSVVPNRATWGPRSARPGTAGT